MKIGLVSDIRRAGFLEELSLWVVARALKERGVLSIVLQGAGTSPDSGAKGVLSEFAMEQFTICAVEAELLSSYGIFEQVQGYVTCESPMYDWICTIEDVPLKLEADSDSKNPQQAEKEKKPRIFLEHPMILGHQGRMHEISEKPKEKEAYLFADIKSMTEGKRQWIWQYAQRKQLSTVILFDADSRQVRYLKGKDKPEETAAQRISLKQYIGYIWKSAAVVTDTYCGTTVSTLHEKDFAVFLSDEKKEAEKQQEFLEMLRLADHIADAEQLPEKDYVIVNSQAFRGALHRRRPRLQEQLERELRLERGDLLIKNPVRLPISQCNGCEACVAVCPENAIRMEMNKKGFLYPVVDATSCNECDWCVNVH